MDLMISLKKFWEKLKKLLKEMWDSYQEYYQKYGGLEDYQEYGSEF